MQKNVIYIMFTPSPDDNQQKVMKHCNPQQSDYVMKQTAHILHDKHQNSLALPVVMSQLNKMF